MNDDARAQGWFRARRDLGTQRLQRGEERDKEKASRVAQQVRRAAALTAELAAQHSLKTRSLRCATTHPEPVTSQPNQATSTHWPRAARSPWSRAVLPRERQLSRFFTLTEGFCGAQTLTVAAVLDETCSFCVKATGKDESSMRRQVTIKKLQDLRRSRDHWRNAVRKSNASKTVRKRWSFSGGNDDSNQISRDDFEQEFKQKLMSGFCNSSIKEQEKDLQELTNELQTKA